MLNKNLKICDFSRKGNLIRFAFTMSSNYTGDDWDDTPYEFNAGSVYEEYIQGFADFAVPFTFKVLEPSSDFYYSGSPYCKNDMKENRCPCLLILTSEDQKKLKHEFKINVGNKNVQHIYFNMTYEELKKDLLKLGCIEVAAVRL